VAGSRELARHGLQLADVEATSDGFETGSHDDTEA
jgi:hypothetical protein